MITISECTWYITSELGLVNPVQFVYNNQW